MKVYENIMCPAAALWNVTYIQMCKRMHNWTIITHTYTHVQDAFIEGKKAGEKKVKSFWLSLTFSCSSGYFFNAFICFKIVSLASQGKPI